MAIVKFLSHFFRGPWRIRGAARSHNKQRVSAKLKAELNSTFAGS